MLLSIKKAYPEIVKELTVIRFRQDHLSYEFVADVLLKDDARIHIRDYLFLDGTRKYSYHWQNMHGILIARWDNAPHWCDVSTFPHHLHIGPGSDVVASNVKSLGDAMEEVKNWWNSKNL